MEFSYTNVDSDLNTYNENNQYQRQQKSRRNRNKMKAEAQFDVTAAPKKLEVFFKEMLELQPDLPDVDAEITGQEEDCPMIFEPQTYPSNTDELAVEVLEAANNLLELQSEEEIALNTFNSHEIIEDVNKQMKKLKTASLTAHVDRKSIDIRHAEPNLTAKRLSVKALQLFSFNENYRKHFSMNPDSLRALNTDMLIDSSPESAHWLNYLGEKYQDIYLNKYVTAHSVEPPDNDEDILQALTPGNIFFRALGFSTILKNIAPDDLRNIQQPLSNMSNFYANTHYADCSLKFIFDYFGFKVFGIDPLLNFQLNYLHLIPYYLKDNKKQKIFDLFEDLDIKIRN